MKCPGCRHHELVTIEIKWRDAPLVLSSCSACELRWWRHNDDLVPLADLLRLVAPSPL